MFKNDELKLEHMPNRATKMNEGMVNLSYKKRLEEFCLFNKAQQKLSRDMTVLYKCIWGVNTMKGKE